MTWTKWIIACKPKGWHNNQEGTKLSNNHGRFMHIANLYNYQMTLWEETKILHEVYLMHYDETIFHSKSTLMWSIWYMNAYGVGRHSDHLYLCIKATGMIARQSTVVNLKVLECEMINKISSTRIFFTIFRSIDSESYPKFQRQIQYNYSKGYILQAKLVLKGKNSKLRKCFLGKNSSFHYKWIFKSI